MVYIFSVAQALPKHVLGQEEAKHLIMEIFKKEERKVKRLLPIFDNAKIQERQLACEIDWYREKKSFKERNDLYIEQSVALSLEAIDQCLQNEEGKGKIPYEAIDLIVYVSSTGISTPSIDAYLINERAFNESIVRMPLWGLGCAGGAIGLSRVLDWLSRYPQKNALLVCSELCSLTFQQEDLRTSNLVGTALFGDGVAAALLVGKESKLVDHLPAMRLSVESTSSYLKKDSLGIMGWKVTNHGFEVVFSKKIPQLVKKVWKTHLQSFLSEHKIEIADLDRLIAHPGGRKVLEEMEKIIEGRGELLSHSYEVLSRHGNMSSATVLYVLQHYMAACNQADQELENKPAILNALGPGFCSELLLLRWTSE